MIDRCLMRNPTHRGYRFRRNAGSIPTIAGSPVTGCVHLSRQALALLKRNQRGPLVFTLLGTKPFQDFTHAKRRLDELSGVAG
jgi:hypothetical protein